MGIRQTDKSTDNLIQPFLDYTCISKNTNEQKSIMATHFDESINLTAI